MRFYDGETKVETWGRFTATTHRVIYEGEGDDDAVIPIASVTYTRVMRRHPWGALLWMLVCFAFGVWWMLERDDTNVLTGVMLAALPGAFYGWRYGALFVVIGSAGGRIEHRQFRGTDADRTHARAFCEHVERVALAYRLAA